MYCNQERQYALRIKTWLRIKLYYFLRQSLKSFNDAFSKATKLLG